MYSEATDSTSCEIDSVDIYVSLEDIGELQGCGREGKLGCDGEREGGRGAEVSFRLRMR